MNFETKDIKPGAVFRWTTPTYSDDYLVLKMVNREEFLGVILLCVASEMPSTTQFDIIHFYGLSSFLNHSWSKVVYEKNK